MPPPTPGRTAPEPICRSPAPCRSAGRGRTPDAPASAGQITEQAERHEAVLMTPQHLLELLHPPGGAGASSGQPHVAPAPPGAPPSSRPEFGPAPRPKAMPPRGIPGSLRRLADLMRLRATKIEHTFGRFGTFGCLSRAIDAVTRAPHQCRQGLPLCRAEIGR